MRSGPREPREEAAYVDLAALQNGKTFADYGHVSLVEVAKWPGARFTGDKPVNQVSGIASLLNSNLRHTR